MSAEYLALLRGINVGGNNKLPMRDLKDIVAALGCENVQTFIQSGNVVFDLGSAGCEGLGQRLTEAIAAQYGFSPAVLLRTREELEAVFVGNPFVKQGLDADLTHVVFLMEPPTEAHVDSLGKLQIAPDQLVILGREIYLYLPNGVSGANLTSTNFYSKIGLHSARNWRTVTKLLSLMTD